MKNIYNIICSFVVVSLFFSSCKDEEGDIFDKTTTQRIKEKNAEIASILKSSDNGWRINYYPDPEVEGGYNMLMKFTGVEDVTMQGDLFFPTGTHVSKYEMNGSQGPVLNFKTSNPVLHRLADPELFYYGEGMLGDIEFVWQRTSINQDTLFFKGKKNQTSVRFIRFDKDWNEYIGKINTNINAFASRFFKRISISGGDSYEIGGYHAINRTIYPIVSENGKTLDYQKEIVLGFTDKGVEFYSPVKISDKKIQYLDYDAVSGKFNIADAGVEGTLDPINAPVTVFEGAKDSIFRNTDSYYFSTYDATINTIVQSIKSKFAQYEKASLILSRIGIVYTGTSYRLSLYIAVNGTFDSSNYVYVPLAVRKDTDRSDKVKLFASSRTFSGHTTYRDLIKNECTELLTAIAGSNLTGKDYIVMPNFTYTNFLLGSTDRDFSMSLNIW